MKKKSKETKHFRGYHRHSKAWYCDLERDGVDISFGLYDKKDGGTSGEMKIEWETLLDGLAPQLKMLRRRLESFSFF